MRSGNGNDGANGRRCVYRDEDCGVVRIEIGDSAREARGGAFNTKTYDGVA
jgi:hypothetical protein